MKKSKVPEKDKENDPTITNHGHHTPEESGFLSKNILLSIHGSNLPHWNQDGKYVFFTFRLGDSLPKDKQQELLAEMQTWRKTHPTPWSEQTIKEYKTLFPNRIERLLDNGYGCCILRNPDAAQIVSDTLKYNNGIKYELVDYVIMPNHVHVLVKLDEHIKVEDLMNEWKSVSSHKLRKIFKDKWCGWMEKYHDRHIRNKDHYDNVLEYIDKNYNSGGVIRMSH